MSQPLRKRAVDEAKESVKNGSPELLAQKKVKACEDGQDEAENADEWNLTVSDIVVLMEHTLCFIIGFNKL